MNPVREYIRDISIRYSSFDLYYHELLISLNIAGYYRYPINTFEDYDFCQAFCEEDIPKKDFAFVNNIELAQILLENGYYKYRFSIKESEKIIDYISWC